MSASVNAPTARALEAATCLLALSAMSACSTMASNDSEPAIPRAADVPHSMARAYFAPGVAKINVKSGSNVDGDANALMWGAAFEGVGNVVGGGISIDAYFSDDDLIDSPAPVDASVLGVSVFPHVTFRPGTDKFRVPIRFGPEVQLHTLDFGASSTTGDVDWISVGAALEVEPEFDFFRNDKSALSIYGSLRGGGGWVAISGPTDDYTSDSRSFGAEIGMRYEIGAVLISAGFLNRYTDYDESEVENGTFVEETEFSFRGFFISAGARW
jgi:hypothetical protein